MRYLKFGSKALKATNGRQCQGIGELIGKATLTLMVNLSLSKFNSAMEVSKQLSTLFLRIGGLVRALRATSTSDNHQIMTDQTTGLWFFLHLLYLLVLFFFFGFLCCITIFCDKPARFVAVLHIVLLPESL